MTDHERLIGKVDTIITQAQLSIETIQGRLDELLQNIGDPIVLATVLARQAQAVKTLADAVKILSAIRNQGDTSSDTEFFK